MRNEATGTWMILWMRGPFYFHMHIGWRWLLYVKLYRLSGSGSWQFDAALGRLWVDATWFVFRHKANVPLKGVVALWRGAGGSAR